MELNGKLELKVKCEALTYIKKNPKNHRFYGIKYVDSSS